MTSPTTAGPDRLDLNGFVLVTAAALKIHLVWTCFRGLFPQKGNGDVWTLVGFAVYPSAVLRFVSITSSTGLGGCFGNMGVRGQNKHFHSTGDDVHVNMVKILVFRINSYIT